MRAIKTAAASVPAAISSATPEARLALAERLWDWVPHPGQREFLTLRLPDGSEPRVLVAACGRRWGKTEALGCDIATRILTDPELIQMGVAPTVDQAAGLMDSVEEKLLEVMENPDLLAEFPVVAELEFKRTPYPHIRNKKTRQMIFSCRSAAKGGRNLRGKGTTRKAKRFRVIVDERAFVDDEAIERAIKPMLATVAKGGGQLVEISSPNGRRGGFYEDFLKGDRQEGRYRSVRLPSAQNPLVDREFLDEMRAEMSDSAFRAEFEAEFVDRAGAVFPQAEIDASLCDDDYGNAPLWGVQYVAGVDFGRRGDWTVCAVMGVNDLTPQHALPSVARLGSLGSGREMPGESAGLLLRPSGPPSVSEPKRTTVGRGAGGEGKTLRLVHLFRVQGLGYAAQIEKLADVLAEWNVCRVAPDRTGVGDAPCEMLALAIAARRLRCEMEEFVFTGPSKAALFDRLTLRLGRRELRFPPHPVLLSELANFEATPTWGGHEKLEAAKGHDDCVCALALAVQAAGPLIAHSGALVIASGGRRELGARDQGSKGWGERDFACGDGYRNENATGRTRPAAGLRLLRQALATAYGFAPGRRAGAQALRFFRGWENRRLTE